MAHLRASKHKSIPGLAQFTAILLASGALLGQVPTASCSALAPEPAGCHTLAAGEIESGIRLAAGVSNGESDENLRIEVLDQSRSMVPRGRLIFNWTGVPPASPDGVSVLHGFLDADTGARQPVWARVRMSVRRRMPVAKLDLPPGAVLKDEQWELRATWVPFPEGYASTNGFVGESSSGARLKRAVREAEVIQASWLDYPLDIRRGQVVDLHVRSGATHLRLQATALSNAHHGESVELRLSDRGLSLSAITFGPGQALVTTTNLVGGSPASNPAGGNSK